MHGPHSQTKYNYVVVAIITVGVYILDINIKIICGPSGSPVYKNNN